jgi:hypothetical protein
VCRFHVAASEKPCTSIYLAPLSGVSQSERASTFGSVVLSPTGSITLVPQLREKLLLCSSYLPLGVPNGVSSTCHQAFFSGAIAREKEDFCKGILSLPIFYFVIFLLYFIFCLHHFFKNTKKLVPL